MAKTGERPDGYAALPNRFKDYIAALELRVSTLEAQAPCRSSKQGARLKLVDRSYAGNDGFLPDDTVFEFLIDGAEFRVQAARPDKGICGVEVSTQMGACVVHPCVSNVVVIGKRDL